MALAASAEMGTDPADDRFFLTRRDTAFICKIPKGHCDNMASKHFQRIAASGESLATVIRCAATASEHSVWWLVAPP